ncbi:MAG: hypothetical protein UZ18_ATM001000501 [Armatimonadetes bacterium OLB18]|nr:MAG: hypothetical protein UZ18_ATM001000501 [Armatimonadetes bacterium OLB18]
MRGEVRARRRRGFAHRHPLLVLRLRNDGHGPAPPEGDLGVQWNGAARGGLPRGDPRFSRPEGPASVWNLRTPRSRPGRPRDPPRRRRQNPRLREGGARGRDDAGLLIPRSWRSFDGNRWLDRRTFVFRALSRHEGRIRRYDRVRPADGTRHFRAWRVRGRKGLDRLELAARATTPTRRANSAPARRKTRIGTPASR